MEFCNSCDDYLYIKEFRENNNFKLIYSCKKCPFTKECNNNLIFKKIYKKDDKITFSKNKINDYIIRDKTLPKKKSKCESCHDINENPYQVKYANNSFNIVSFCINCKTSFPYKKIK